MGRWDDRPDDSSDDWRGWKGGKYDNRHRGVSKSRKYRRRNKTKSVSVGIVFCLIIGIFGFILWNQGYLDATIEQSPQSVQDISKTAKEITAQTTEKLSKTVNDQLESPTVKSVEKTFDEVSDKIQKTTEKIPETKIDIPKVELPKVPITSPIRVESGFDASLVEKYIYEFTNDERQKRGVASLARITTIDSIARNHSLDMSNRNYFSHMTPEGLDPTDRGNKAGYPCRNDFGSYYTVGLAENIYQTYTYSSYMTKGIKSSYHWIADEETLAKEIVDGWMDSQGHRENILESKYAKIGVGVAINEDESVYATQNFC